MSRESDTGCQGEPGAKFSCIVGYLPGTLRDTAYCTTDSTRLQVLLLFLERDWAMASTRFFVQSSRASGRQLHRRQPQNVGSGLLESTPRGSSLHTFSRFRPNVMPKQGQSSTSLSLDLSSLAVLESTKAGDMPPKQGWSKWEIMASAALAFAATGSFLVASAMTSPSFSPKIIQQRGGGGGGKPGGSSVSPTPDGGEEEEKEVSVLVDKNGSANYQVSVVYLFFAVENY